MPTKRGQYARILVKVFQDHTRHDPESGDLLFGQDEIRRAADELGEDVRNFPDLNYYMALT